MSTCNQMLAAATKVAMIRKIKSKKSASSCNKKSHIVSSVAQNANNLLQPTTSECVPEAPKYLNSYRLESKNAFNCTLVQGVLEEIVHKHCFGKKYDPESCVKKVKTIASEVLRRVKNFQFDSHIWFRKGALDKYRYVPEPYVRQWVYETSKANYSTGRNGTVQFLHWTCWYRLIVYAQIGENQSQECEAVVRFLWDSSRDKFVTYNLSSASMFTTVTCFGVYLD